MTGLRENRVMEWTASSREERKELYQVVQAIRSSTGLSFDDIYKAAHGKAYARSIHDEANFRKGTIGHKKAAIIRRWVLDNHLALASQIAPEIFDPSLLTRWRDFLRKYARYDAFSISPLSELNLVGRSSDNPVSSQTIRLGENFVFQLQTAIAGDGLAFENVEGKAYPVSLHPDKVSPVTPVAIGKNILPTLSDGATPDPLSDTSHSGLHTFVILVAPQGLLSQMTSGLVSEHPVAAEKLDKIAALFENVPSQDFEVHRLNVIFTV